jgi:radical SAM protein with 4Fe4S-binding SPASM domain
MSRKKSFLDRLTFSTVPFKSVIRSLSIFKIKYTPKRIWNLIAIAVSMFLSKLIRKPIVWGYPPIVMIDPSNICNLRCPMCPMYNGTVQLPKGTLKYENLTKLLDEIGDYIFQIQFWNQGEPFLNKNFIKMIRYAKRMGIMTITSTNGHFITSDDFAEEVVRSGLDQIIFSMDGTNQETYEKYRVNGDYNLVIANLERLSQAKIRLNSRTPLIELQFIVFKHNQDEIDTLKALAKKNRVDRISFKTAMVYSADQAEDFLPEDQKKELYESDSDGRHLKRKNGVPNWCNRLWLNPAITWDGRFSPCCFDLDAKHAFANIFEDKRSFKSIWKSEAYNKFRQTVLTDRRRIDICKNCTEGMKQPYAQIIELDEL